MILRYSVSNRAYRICSARILLTKRRFHLQQRGLPDERGEEMFRGHRDLRRRTREGVFKRGGRSVFRYGSVGICAILLVFLMCFSYACAQNDAAAGGSADGDYYEEGRNSASDSGGSYGMGTPQSSSTAGDYALGSTGEVGIGYDSANGAGNMSGESADALKDPERKEIQSGSVRIVVDEVADAYDKIAALIDSLGGYEFSKSKNNSESDISIYVTVKIPPDKLNDFETGLSDAVGKDAIHQYALSSEDITSQYYDSQTRLETMRISLAKYQEFLGTAQTVGNLIRRPMSLMRFRTDLRRLQTVRAISCYGCLSFWSARCRFWFPWRSSCLSLFSCSANARRKSFPRRVKCRRFPARVRYKALRRE